ncbi:MAG: 16S rRNA (uracil1498-N3)-methyltransferase [Maribacter sp.]|jgi:16S rRNA (uracil1498-N3)-methyltransferase
MQLFYTQNIQGDTAILGEEEARHCVRVLRKKTGDTIHFIDGKGGLYTGRITDLSKKDCWIKITDKVQQTQRDFNIHIAIAPTKNIARTEWFLEKCTELGIDQVTFLLCKHSERKRIRLDRLEKIVLSATKQSLKAFLPKVNDFISYKEFIKGVKDSNENKYLCWVSEDNRHFLDIAHKKTDLLILIGPEGDFSEQEIQIALDNNFIAVGLGESRLRTETAGVVACHLGHILNME